MSNELLNDEDEMRDEYDFSNAKPHPLAAYFRENGVRVLDEDLREAFPDSTSVNKALRELIQATQIKSSTLQELKKAS